MQNRPEAALLIVAHGSTVNPDSSAPTLAHAAEIRRRKIFAEVQCAFWKEEPSLRDAKFLFDPESIQEVYVVPNFISEGYFTQTVVPRELELNGLITKRSSGQTWNYCEPVGNHSMMTELLLKRAGEIVPDELCNSAKITASPSGGVDIEDIASKRYRSLFTRRNRRWSCAASVEELRQVFVTGRTFALATSKIASFRLCAGTADAACS